MASWTKNVGLKSTLQQKDLSKIESITQSIHQKGNTEKVPSTKMTVEVPKTLLKKVKIKIAENEVTLKDYIIGLIQTDLGMQ